MKNRIILLSIIYNEFLLIVPLFKEMAESLRRAKCLQSWNQNRDSSKGFPHTFSHHAKPLFYSKKVFVTQVYRTQMSTDLPKKFPVFLKTNILDIDLGFLVHLLNILQYLHYFWLPILPSISAIVATYSSNF